jgi:rhodanese-related sulfurtransferase
MDEQQQLAHYANKLAYELDSWDLSVAVESGDNVVVLDARSPEIAREHIELIGGLDWWKRDGHPTSHAEAATVAVDCGCN